MITPMVQIVSCHLENFYKNDNDFAQNDSIYIAIRILRCVAIGRALGKTFHMHQFDYVL